MATATRGRAKAPAADKVDGGKLYDALLASAKQAKLKVVSTKGMYFRVQAADGRTAAYVVLGRTVATVYPCCLAEAMPSGVKFRTVALGSHHYGRGEVIVSVSGEADLDNGLAALKAAVAAPAVPKKAKAEVEQVAPGPGTGPAVTANTVVIRDAAAEEAEVEPGLAPTRSSRKKVSA